MASCPRLRSRRLLQAKPFFFAATKIRIGRGTAPPQRPQQAKLFFIATTKIRIRRGALWWQGRLQQAKPFSPASIPKSGLEIKNRCTKDGVNGENLASIPKSGLEIKNRCTRQGINRQNPASILKFGPEIMNRCTQQGVNGENLALILKFGPEIENRCTNQPIFSTHPQHIPPARVHHALTTRLALNVLHVDGLHSGSTAVRQRFDSGSTVAAKAGADAPGGGISLCFCRRGCAAPAQKPSRSTKPAATLNDTRRSTRLKSRHAQRSAATKTNTKNSIFVNPGLALGRVPKMRSRKGI